MANNARVIGDEHEVVRAILREDEDCDEGDDDEDAATDGPEYCCAGIAQASSSGES